MSQSIELGADGVAESCKAECPLAQAATRAEDAYLDAERVRLDRRGFLTKSMLVAAAAALAACGAGVDSITAPNNVGATVKLSDYPALANVGGVVLTSINGSPLAIVRTGQSTFIALSRICPHEGSTINTNGSSGFICPRHGARFDSNGTWTGGQRTSSMRSYSVTYDATAGTLAIA